MPLSALEHVAVDYKLPVSAIGPLIVNLSRRLEDKAHKRGQDWLAQRFREKSQDAGQRTEVIQSVLFKDKTLPMVDMGAHE